MRLLCTGTLTHSFNIVSKLEIDGKPVGKCFRLNTHAHTDGRTGPKPNAPRRPHKMGDESLIHSRGTFRQNKTQTKLLF